MKKVLFLLFVMALGYAPRLRAQDAENPFVHCIVLDKTKSMIGRDGTKAGTTNIWEDVQNYCCGMIDGFSPSSTVLFYTFDKNLYGPDVFEIKSEADKEAIKQKVRSVTVDGQYTWIASNLDKVIKSVYDRYPKENYNNMIYLLTDGIEEQHPCNIAKVIKAYDGYVGDYDHLYYVDLRGLLKGSNTTESKEFKDAFKNGKKADIVNGYPKIVNISPMFSNPSYEIKEGEGNPHSFKIAQQFLVTRGELTKDFSFEASIPDGIVKGVNFDISPSKLSIGNLELVEKGKYRVEFMVENVNDITLFDCVIPVQLKGCTGENTLTIEPSSFSIVFKMPPETIEIHTTDTITKTDTIYIEAKQKEQKVIVKSNKYSVKSKTK